MQEQLLGNPSYASMPDGCPPWEREFADAANRRSGTDLSGKFRLGIQPSHRLTVIIGAAGTFLESHTYVRRHADLVSNGSGRSGGGEQLLPLVYEELRKLAAAKLAHEKPGQTLQATGLVHEAYLRLVDVDKAQHWDHRRHFFAAAAEAMRRILVETARRKGRQKHGGDRKRNDLCDFDMVGLPLDDEVLDLQ